MFQSYNHNQYLIVYTMLKRSRVLFTVLLFGLLSVTTRLLVPYASAAEGLVAAYNFNESSGTTTADLSGNGHVGTLNSGVNFYSGGRYNGAAQFNGTTGMITIADAPDLRFSNTMTLEAWVKPTSLNGWRSILLKEKPNWLVYGLYANTNANVPYAEINNGMAGTDARGDTQLPLNAWTHLSATYNGTTLKMYVNGIEAATKTFSGTIESSTNPLQIGANSIWGEHFEGLIDDVRLYNRVLSQAEIQADMDKEVGITSSVSPSPSLSQTPSPTPTATPPASAAPTPSADPRATTGQWSQLYNWPIVAVNTVLLPNGNILAWDGWEIPSRPRVMSTTTNSVVTNTFTDTGLFCSAHSILDDGRVLTVGGHQQNGDGIVDTNAFNTTDNTWTRMSNMAQQRWYPSLTKMADGNLVAISGMINGNTWANTPEIYNAKNNTWQNLTGVDTSDMQDIMYPLSYLAPNGAIYSVAATNAQFRKLDVNNKTWTTLPTPPIRYGSTAMYRPGKLLYSGGGNTMYGTANGKTAIVDLNQGTSWRTVPSMQYGRYMHNLVVMADGDVIAVGGSDTVNLGATAGPKAAEIFDVETETWQTMPAQQQPRMYHSTALLLPDGRVLVAGGGRYGGTTAYTTAEYYSPPYLFKGARPTISSAPANATYGSLMTLTSPEANTITKVALIGLGSNTHTLDMDQRYVDVSFTKNDTNINVTMPTNGNISPPGYYMIFIINETGVPSVAKIIRLTQSASPNPTPTVSPSSSPSPSPTVTPTPMPNGNLVAAYNFNETSGTIVSDRTNKGHTGTITGPATFTTAGKYDGGLAFNGISNYVTVNDAVDLRLTNSMTLEAWIKPTTITSWRTVIFKEAAGWLSYALYGNTDRDKPSVEINTGTTGIDTLGSWQLPINSWTHLTASYDGITLKMYVNGTLATQRAVSGSIITSTGVLRIGGNTIWGEYFEGVIDDVRLYNRVLTPAEIITDMNTAVQ